MTSATVPISPSIDAKRRRHVVMIAAACVVAFVAIVWIFAALMGGDTPRLNENAVVLSKFVASRRFEQLPFDQQRQFYKVMDDRDAELDQGFASKRLSESEYRAGLEAAWLGKHINRVEKYFALSPGQARTTYLNKLVDKKERKRAKPKNNADTINADETAAELRVEKWPAAERTQWTTFHDAYRAQKKAIEKSRQPQTKPAR